MQPRVRRRWTAVSAALLCLLTAASGPAQPPPTAPALVRSGIAVQVRSASVAPTVELSGEVRSTHTSNVISHYGYWVGIDWLAPEGSHIEKGQTAAIVNNENMADRTASAGYWLKEAEATASETEAANALNEAERALTVQQAKWDVREAELELAALLAEPGKQKRQAAELDVKGAELELEGAQAALQRLQALGEEAGVSHQKIVEAQHAVDLAGIHRSEAQNALDALKQGQTRTDLLAAQAKVSQAKAALAAAEDSAEADRARDDAGLARARAQVEWVRSKYKELDDTSHAMKRVAGASGTVLWPTVTVGGRSRPGLASLWATPILTIIDPHHAVFAARATERQVSRLRVGREARVRLEGATGEPLAGRVAAIGATSEDMVQWRPVGELGVGPATGVLMYEVVITMDARGGMDFYQGLGGRARVSLGPPEQHTLVPRASVRESDGLSWVSVKTPGGWTARRVVTGGGDGDDVEVLKGLQPGETVALLAE